jgi:WD40 repeat protein
MSTETTKVQKSKGKKQRVQETLIKDEKFSLEGSTGAVSGIKFDPESSNTLYSTSWDHSVRIWDLEEQTNVHTMVPCYLLELRKGWCLS